MDGRMPAQLIPNSQQYHYEINVMMPQSKYLTTHHIVALPYTFDDQHDTNLACLA